MLENEDLASLRDSGNPRTTRQLIEDLAPRVGTWDRSAWDSLAYELVGHLEEMEQDGTVTRQAGPPVRWSLAMRTQR